jgi:hypothetical protein
MSLVVLQKADVTGYGLTRKKDDKPALTPQKQHKHTAAVPLHAMECLGERRYSSYSFLTSALDGSEWSALRLSRPLAPGKGP